MLDWALNGVPVYIRKRPIDGAVYATTFDFSKFIREAALETMRVHVPKNALRNWDAAQDPRVKKKIAEWERASA
jgi:hypothetical protein